MGTSTGRRANLKQDDAEHSSTAPDTSLMTCDSVDHGEWSARYERSPNPVTMRFAHCERATCGMMAPAFPCSTRIVAAVPDADIRRRQSRPFLPNIFFDEFRLGVEMPRVFLVHVRQSQCRSVRQRRQLLYCASRYPLRPWCLVGSDVRQVTISEPRFQ